MQVVFEVDGRKAVPVRALPWMTSWWFGADDVAYALGHEMGREQGDERDYASFSNVFSYRLEGDELVTLRSLDWERVEIALKEHSSLGLLREDWEARATAALPAGAFVWLEEWAEAYNQSPDGPGPADAMAAAAVSAHEAQPWRGEADDRRLILAPSVPETVRDAVLAGIPPRLQARDAASSSPASQAIESAPGQPCHNAGTVAEAAETDDESDLAVASNARDSHHAEAVSSSPPGPPALTTDEVCAAFDGVAGRSAARWKDLLMKDRPDWAIACRASEGRRGNGGKQSTWWPIKLAEGIVTGPTKTSASLMELDRAFARRSELRPFRGLWRGLRHERASIWGD